MLDYRVTRAFLTPDKWEVHYLHLSSKTEGSIKLLRPQVPRPAEDCVAAILDSVLPELLEVQHG